MMLSLFSTSLLLLLLLLLLNAGSAVLFREVCYGSDFTVYLWELGNHHTLFFTREGGRGPRTQVMEDYKKSVDPQDPHYVLTSRTLTVVEVTEKDSGVFSTGEQEHSSLDVLELKVLDCSQSIQRLYGKALQLSLPSSQASRVYSVDFTPQGNPTAAPLLLWSRTSNLSGGGARGRLERNRWLMDGLTQQDSGFYTFRGIKNKFVSRNKLTVEEHYQNMDDKVEGDLLYVRFWVVPDHFDLTFSPAEDSSEAVVLMRAGRLQDDTMFTGRMQHMEGSLLNLMIEDLRVSDSGRYELTDKRGNLALVLELEVQPQEPPVLMLMGVVVFILVLVIICCCCCVKKCKKKPGKTSVPPTETYYHYDSQPNTSAHPSSSHGPAYSAPPPPRPKETGPTEHHLGYSPFNPLAVDPLAVDPLAVDPLAVDPLAVDPLCSDAGVQFDLKFSSPPPLSSHSSCQDVYTSDKLNFL